MSLRYYLRYFTICNIFFAFCLSASAGIETEKSMPLSSIHILDTIPKSPKKKIKDEIIQPSCDSSDIVPDKSPFPDQEAWKTHLDSFMKPIISYVFEQGMRAGTYKVSVKFVIEKDGSVSDIKALNDPGFGLGRFAERIVEKGPAWPQVTWHDKNIRYYHTEVISFVVPRKLKHRS